MPDRFPVNIDNIRISDRSFFLHHQIRSEPLISSIKEVGVVNPPVLQKISDSDEFRVVCGFRRVHAAQMCGIRELECRVYPPDSPDQDLLLISLHDNLATQALHPLEKSIAIEKLEAYFDKQEIIDKYLPLLGLASHERAYQNIAPLARLEDNFQDALYRGELAQPVAVRLSRLNRQDRLAVFDLFEKVHLSFSKQKEVAEYLIEISQRDEAGISNITRSEPIVETLLNPDLSKPGKGESIRGILRKRRYPELTQAEEKFQEIRRSLKLGRDIKLVAPASFESDKFKIQFEVDSVKDLQKKIERLKKTGDEPGWEKLFGL